eukprot:1402461-Alexandrium_andersonii.AAC.1
MARPGRWPPQAPGPGCRSPRGRPCPDGPQSCPRPPARLARAAGPATSASPKNGTGPTRWPVR